VQFIALEEKQLTGKTAADIVPLRLQRQAAASKKLSDAPAGARRMTNK
jgi:hypothetical protein